MKKTKNEEKQQTANEYNDDYVSLAPVAVIENSFSIVIRKLGNLFALAGGKAFDDTPQHQIEFIIM